MTGTAGLGVLFFPLFLLSSVERRWVGKCFASRLPCLTQHAEMVVVAVVMVMVMVLMMG